MSNGTGARTSAAYVLALGLALFVGLGIGAAAEGVAGPSADDEAPLWTELAAGGASGIAPDAPLDMSSFARLAKRLMPTVVGITVSKTVSTGAMFRDHRYYFYRFFGPMPEEFENKGIGSGFVISAEGYILTNNHVVEGADEITVRFADGTRYPAEIVGADAPTDIALLRISPGGEVAVAPLGDSDALEVGEWVMAIGNPFGLSQTVTAGIVSAKGRSDVTPSGRRLIASFIQTDASINPGNSGGPLFNTKGEVVGMATAINASGQGIGFAIPVNMIKTLLPQLRRGRVDRSWLGVMIRDVTEEHVEALGLPSARGAIVARVVPGGPAERGGLRAGDVVEAFNDEPVDSTVDLQWLASTAGAGTDTTIEVFRGGSRERLRIQLAAMPDDLESPGPGPRRRVSRGDSTTVPGIGFRVADITSSLRRRLGLRASSGVVVTDVDAGSAAAQVGVRVGDVIRVIGTTKLRSAVHFGEIIGRVRPDQLVSLILSRGDETLFLDFRRARSR